MKDATGEMSMTVIVIIAAAAVLALAKFIWPFLSNKIKGETNNITGGDITYNINLDEFYNA